MHFKTFFPHRGEDCLARILPVDTRDERGKMVEYRGQSKGFHRRFSVLT